MDIVDEQIDTTCRSVLGLTVACARCHDHKFDPFPTEDYYAIAGIFRSTETLYGTNNGQGNRMPSQLISLTSETGRADPPEDISGNKRLYTRRKQQAQEAIDEYKKRHKGEDLKELEKTDTAYKRLKSQLKNWTKKLQEVKKLEKNPPKPTGPVAMGVLDDKPMDCQVHIRGNVNALGDSVKRGYLQVVHVDGSPDVDPTHSGRLEFANWLTSRENPLTARVMVNRIWHHLFGQGLVRTMDNFGATGEKPINQALLDHLAVRFMDNDWSIKRTLREIVLSRTYRLSSDHSDDCFAVDPGNRLCWQMSHRRLDIEAIRDSMLAASGQLDRAPVENSIVHQVGDSNVGRSRDLLAAIEENPSYRSVYLPIVRNYLPAMLKVFDFAEPSIIVGRRNITTVPTQALFMMNDDFVLDQSDHLAGRILKDPSLSSSDRINMAYQIALSRPATAEEMSKSEQYVATACESLSDSGCEEAEANKRSWAGFCQALLASAEFRYLE